MSHSHQFSHGVTSEAPARHLLVAYRPTFATTQALLGEGAWQEYLGPVPKISG